MSFLKTWDETKPAGTRDRSLGDDDIREFKYAIRERLAADHCFYEDEAGHSDVGYHNQCTLVEQGAAPASIANTGRLYTKDMAGITELFFKDSAGNEIQLTSGGVLMALGGAGWRTGDQILSSNTNTPSGWSDVSATYADKFIRISNGTPLTTGGSDTHTHTVSVDGHTHAAGTLVAPYNYQVATSAQWGTTGYMAASYSGGGDATTANATRDLPISGSTASDTATGSAASATAVPAYVQMKMYSKS